MLNKKKDGIKPKEKKKKVVKVTKDKTIARLKIVMEKLRIWRKSIIPFQISTATWSDQKTVSKDIPSAWVIAGTRKSNTLISMAGYLDYTALDYNTCV